MAQLTRKQQIKVEATKLAIETAKIIGSCNWYSVAPLTTEELDEIDKLGETMPGNIYWVDVFKKWMGDAWDYKVEG